MDHVLSEIIKIAIDHKISKVLLFGSRARGDHTERSDYDISFICNDITNTDKQSIRYSIDEIETLYKIDIVFLPHLHGTDSISQNILREGVIIMDRFAYTYENYKSALKRLQEALDDYEQLKMLSIRDGAIQRFEFTTELAWKTMREFLISEDITDINSPKSVLREAFAMKLIEDEAGWRLLISDRNSTSHIYDEKDAEEIFKRICTQHILLFQSLLDKLSSYY